MDEAELYDRIIARFSGVPVDVIEARNFSDEQIQSVVAAYAEIGQIQLSISTQAQTLCKSVPLPSDSGRIRDSI